MQTQRILTLQYSLYLLRLLEIDKKCSVKENKSNSYKQRE